MKGQYYINSFFWSTLRTLLTAVLNFVSVPILLKYFGIDDYGILTLAISTNAYVAILDVSGSSGPIKYFSGWIAKGEIEHLKRVAGTSISFYGLFGIINAVVLLVIAFFGGSWFGLTPNQFETFKIALFILAAFSVLNWSTHIFSQLLIASENVAYTHKVNIVATLMNFAVVLITVYFKLTLNQYFLGYIALQSLVVIPFFYKTKKLHLIDNPFPCNYWREFGEVLKYSLALFAMGVFQAMAAKSRPLLLGLASDNAATILGEYRIIEVFPAFIISLCGALIGIFLPKTSKFVADNNIAGMENIAYNGTKYTSLLTCFICFPILINSAEILSVYVGAEYEYLANWMMLWILTLILNLYNSPMSSLILATGKTRMLVYSSAISCVVSMIINYFLCTTLGVGSAVVGYLIYIIIQQLFYYFYFNNRIMGMNSIRILKMLLVPTLLGGCVALLLMLIPYDWSMLSKGGIIVEGAIKALVWAALYSGVLCIFRFVTINEICNLKRG